jgi:outer membrane biosynthesis protein TonB
MKYETTFEGKPLKIIDSNVNPGKKAQAEVEGPDYAFGKISDSEHVTCIYKDTVCILLKTAKTVQCTCQYFRENPGMICEHLLALRTVKEEDFEAAPADIVALLDETEGWTVNEKGLFVPPSEPVTPDVVAELPPVNEEPPVEKPQAKKPLCKATCQYCELEIKAATQENADKRRDNHEKVCKERPAESSKAEAPKQTKKEPAKKEKPPAEKPKPKEPETPIDPPDEPPHPTPTAVAEDVQDETQSIDEVGEITSSQVQEIIPVAIAKALCNMQKTELFATTDSTNTFFNNAKYADLASIWRAIRAPLTDSGLAIMQTTEPYSNGITVVTTMMHVTGASYTTRLSGTYPAMVDKKTGKPKPQTVQALGSLITYLRRYSLAALVGVSSADDDGEAASGRPPQNKR